MGTEELHKREEGWRESRDVELHGVIGVVFRREYEILYGRRPESTELKQTLVEGDAMPDRPSSGSGATATIEQVQQELEKGTSKRVVVLTGFEAKGWEN